VAAACADGATLPATVPGNVYDDLLAAGLIADPYLGRNEALAHWIGREDWEFTAALPAPPAGAERVDLVADGLDTVATVTLGGREIARTRNQHRSYRWDVTDAARPGLPLAVRFGSVYDLAAQVEAELGPYPAAYDEPFQYVRKMASNFGWDWGPTVVTAGIWRDIRLEAWHTARLAAVRPHAYLVTPTGSHGELRVDAELERTRPDVPVAVTVTLTAPGGAVVATATRPADGHQVRLKLTAGEVDRWWPHTLGAQPLYCVKVELTAGGEVLDTWSGRVGFRHVALVTTPDEAGLSFGFEVAGRPRFARGFNWIPADLLVTRVTKADYLARLTDARDAGADLIRVWGGGLYEQDAFYDACDELGLMVWQDCPFACAAYPESDGFAAEVEAETRDNVTRLVPHPSLVLWNGCNENIWGHVDWGWEPTLQGRGWGARYYYDLLPRVIGELDPSRPYWPGSPYSGTPDRYPNDPDYGCNHSWVVWNEADYPLYAADRPRFMAEFGWCAPAAWSTLRDAVGEDHLVPWDETLMWHYKSQDGLPKLRRAIADGFHEPPGFDAWHYVAQVQQARAVGFGIDHWRSLWPHCQGAVVWQLNDCWPVTSWAAVDSAGVRKPAWYAVRRSFEPRLAVVAAEPGGCVLRLVNNTDEEWEALPLVRRVGLDGETRATWSRPCRVEPQSVATGGTPGQQNRPRRPAPPDLAADEILIVDADATAPDPARRRVVARPDRELAYMRPRYDVATEPVEGGTRVTVTAQTLVRDLLLQADRLGGKAEATLVTLLPGETYTWVVEGPQDLTPGDFAPPVLLDAATAEMSAL
jgi:beta-mannosidase